jgi:hypothetical protein
VPKLLTDAEVNALQDERGKLIADADKILQRCKSEDGRAMNTEETAEFDRLHTRAADIYGTVQANRAERERHERHTAAMGSLAESRGRRSPAAQPGGTAPVDPAAALEGITFNGRPVRLPAGSAALRRADAG